MNVDLDSDHSLAVDISDALSERDKVSACECRAITAMGFVQVKYTVHTKTNLPEFSKQEMSVVREHDEFIWLHNSLEENEEYAGFIVSTRWWATKHSGFPDSSGAASSGLRCIPREAAEARRRRSYHDQGGVPEDEAGARAVSLRILMPVFLLGDAF